MLFRPSLPVRPIVLAALVSLCATAGLAHEFWIEPHEYQVQSAAPLVADLRNGQDFAGPELAYFPKRFQRFDLIRNGQTTPVDGRMGDVPALRTQAPDAGLLVIVHQTAPKTLKYATWEKFATFASHKDFADMRARHDARGLPEKGFSEIYTRHAKALVGVGDAHGSDAPTGLETEFVALSNPYTDDLAPGMSVQLLYQGLPRADTQIEVFARSPEGVVTVTLTRTDAQGQAVIPVQAGHSYLLDAVVLRAAPEGGDAVWETLWAALTFGVPG